MKLGLGWCVLLSSLCCTAAVEFPVPVHAGQLEKMERTSSAQAFVELHSALSNGNRAPAATAGDVTTRQIPPKKGSVYVVFTVSVEAGRSLSVSDYELSCNAMKTKCLGLALPAVNAFDGRLNLVKGPANVKMLFEAPEAAMKAALVAAAGYPLYDVLDIELQKPAPPPEPKPEAAAPADAKPGASDAGKKPEPKKEEPKKAEEKKPEPPKPAEKKPAPPKPAPKPAPKPKPADDWF